MRIIPQEILLEYNVFFLFNHRPVVPNLIFGYAPLKILMPHNPYYSKSEFSTWKPESPLTWFKWAFKERDNRERGKARELNIYLKKCKEKKKKIHC